MKQPKKVECFTQLITIGVLLLLVVGIYFTAPGSCKSLFSLVLHGSVDEFINYLRSLGSSAMWVSMALIIVINTFGVLPNIIILTANGVIFGMFAGTVISWIGECIGSALGFFLLRYLLHDYAHRFIASSNSLHYLDKLNGNKGFQIMLLARAIPYMPSGLVTAFGAVSNMRFREFIVATAIGKLPSVWLEVTLGHDAMNYQDHLGRLVGITTVSIAAYLMVAYSRRKAKKPD